MTPEEQTKATFERKWREIPDYGRQINNSVRCAWYLERFGFASEDALREFLAPAANIMDAGCGPGVDTAMLVRNANPTANILAVDASESAVKECRQRFIDPRVFVVCADLMDLDRGKFDVISCDQVLHHTKDPALCFSRLVDRHLAPGGAFLLYVYSKKGPLREFADDHLRSLFTADDSDDTCWDFSRRMARLGRAIQVACKEPIEVRDDIPELGIRRGTYDPQRFFYDHALKCFWNDAYDERTNTAINYDWYRPALASRYSAGEVAELGISSGLTIEHLSQCSSGISAIFRKKRTQ